MVEDQKLVTEKKVPAIGDKSASTKLLTAKAKRVRTGSKKVVHTKVSEKERLDMIAENAYYRAESRGFTPGGEESDWFDAENEIDKLLKN